MLFPSEMTPTPDSVKDVPRMFFLWPGEFIQPATTIAAAFSGVITGAILAFLWFNIPPARFYMGETGIMGLTITLATLAFLTDSVLVLPVIAFPLVATSGSVILQLLSKKFRGGKRLFKLAPIHHHFEAIGWSSHKVTMRFWILSVVFAIIGLILTMISR